MSKKRREDGIKIVEVRVRNFRCLQNVNLTLAGLTVLIGENNSGKTSFLEALFAAIGAGRRIITAEDVFLAPAENTVPKRRTVVVDLLVRPADSSGKVIANFPEGSYWLSLWGNGVAQDDEDSDFVAFRTQMRWDATRGEYITERKFLKDWPVDPLKWEDAKVNESAGSVSPAVIEPLALYFMDAKRDIQDEMQSRTSFWHRLISDLGLSEKEIEALEKRLTKLNQDIIGASDVLRHVRDNLDDLYEAVNSPKGSVSITPTARTLRDLSKGMDVSFATQGAQTFPLIRHGMGTRSVAALLTFRAYTTWRQMQAKTDAVHPMLALEEPEAHLHPQAQRALFHLIQGIPGQRIVSTHSPYIAAEAHISQFRVFRKVGPETIVTEMDTKLLGAEDMRKINRRVLDTRGDLLYARALVLCSGETEEQALPVFAEKYWGRHPNDLGVGVVGVGGDGNYLPFLRLAHSFGIPWYVFSDGERHVRKQLKSDLRKINDSLQSPNVFVIADDMNIERYLASEEYKDVLVEMIISLEGSTDEERTELRKTWAADPNIRDSIYRFLNKNKTKCAKPLAEAITGMDDDNLRFPLLIGNLLSKVSSDHGLKRKKVKGS